MTAIVAKMTAIVARTKRKLSRGKNFYCFFAFDVIY